MTKSNGRHGGDAARGTNQRALRPATMMMGHGFDPALSEGALKPPIFLTSTFAFESAAAGKRHFETLLGKRSGDRGLVYSRFNGPNQEILEDRLRLWEGAEAALSFSSGMSAITSLMMTYVHPGDVVVHSGPLYGGTETLIRKLMADQAVTAVDFPARAGPDEIAEVLAHAAGLGPVTMIFLESPANPTNVLVDIEAVRETCDRIFAADKRPVIAIDNTFLGPLWAKPLASGADISIYSLTKYVGGHSDLVGGALVGPSRLLEPVRSVRNVIGTIIDPHTAWMLLRSLETLELRMTRAGENAERLCNALLRNPNVEQISYLGFAEGQQADVYRRHCTGAGSTFSLYVAGGEEEAFAFLDALEIAKLAVSLGGTESLASAPAAMTHLGVPADRRLELGIKDNLVRVSVGIEDPDDLISDFEQALAVSGEVRRKSPRRELEAQHS
ncbi:MAG TPA: cystathionine gamma-synthase family protein [Sphingomicrobium sp.]|nr:cystathionine gamma-synthase family protein [Sphingomicrobium sp.]